MGRRFSEDEDAPEGEACARHHLPLPCPRRAVHLESGIGLSDDHALVTEKLDALGREQARERRFTVAGVSGEDERFPVEYGPARVNEKAISLRKSWNDDDLLERMRKPETAAALSNELRRQAVHVVSTEYEVNDSEVVFSDHSAIRLLRRRIENLETELAVPNAGTPMVSSTIDDGCLHHLELGGATHAHVHIESVARGEKRTIPARKRQRVAIRPARDANPDAPNGKSPRFARRDDEIGALSCRRQSSRREAYSYREGSPPYSRSCTQPQGSLRDAAALDGLQVVRTVSCRRIFLLS